MASMQPTITIAFAKQGLYIKWQSPYFTVENSEECTVEKIKRITISVGFSPIVVGEKINQKYVFTVVPYCLPQAIPQLDVLPGVLPFYRTANECSTIIKRHSEASYQVHFQKNKNAILNLAEGMTGSALVLGLGNGNDIPLVELATQFDEVVVTDIDLQTIQETIQRLPAGLQQKVRPLQQDLTGLCLLAEQKIDSFPKDITFLDATLKLTSFLDEKLNKEPQITHPGTHDLVISSMLTSQLTSLLAISVKDYFYRKFPHLVNANAVQALRDKPFNGLSSRICIYHLLNLKDWVLPKGKIYYADTFYQSHIVKGVITPAEPTIPTSLITNAIKEVFVQIKESEEWNWETNASTDKIVGSLMVVEAYYLRPQSKYLLQKKGK